MVWSRARSRLFLKFRLSGKINTKEMERVKSSLPKTQFSYYLRLANFSVTVLIFWLLVWYGVFLYKNFYKVAIESEIIIVLRQQVAVSQINYAKFLDVLNNIKTRQTLEALDARQIKNPFLLPIKKSPI